jgi:hypothetical protein
MKAHDATLKAIPGSMGQKKRAYFTFFVPGPAWGASSLWVIANSRP